MRAACTSRTARRVAVRLCAALLTATLAAGGGLVAATSGEADSIADRAKGLEQQIAELRDTLEGASKELVEAAVKLRRAQVQLAQARAALADARRRLAVAKERDADLAARLAYARAQQDKAERDLRAGEQAQRETRAALGRIAREAYVGRGLSGLSVALQAETPEQFADRLAVASAALQSQSGAVDRLAVEQADLRARGAKVEALRAQVAELKRQSALVVQERADAARAAREAAVRIAGLVRAERVALAAIQRRVAAERARLAALNREQARLRAVLQARARAAARAARARRGAATVPRSAGGYLSSAADGPITSPFGRRYHPILHYWRLHSGIDYGIPCGTPVRATAPGTVISAGWGGGYGNRVVIDHGLVRGVALATTYNHLTRAVVGGGSVQRGQLIGYSGTTGLSTGCHLHFETLANGGYVNPARWL